MLAYSVGTAASSGQFDRSVTALTEASFKHLRVAYGSRHVLGDARYHEAHIAVENALRATGLPTHVAMASAEQLAKEARALAQSATTNAPSLCFTTFVTTKKGDQPLAQNHNRATKSARVNVSHRLDQGHCRNGAGGKHLRLPRRQQKTFVVE